MDTVDRRPRHVLLYGPPAAGKRTVALSLASAYGFKVLDNHVTLDAALRLFDFGSPDCWRLVERLRVELLSAAARARLDVVSTLVFAHPGDRGHVARLAEASESAGTVMTYVQLLPTRAVLEQRVVGASRGPTKVRDATRLGVLLDRHDLATPINDDDLSIDNSELAPDVVAELIAARLSGGRPWQ